MTRSRKSTSGRILSIDGALCDIPFVAWWSYDPTTSPFELVADLHHRQVRLHREHLVEGVDDEHRAGDVTITPERNAVWLRLDDDLGGVLYGFDRGELRSVARMVQQLAPSHTDISRCWDEALRREVSA